MIDHTFKSTEITDELLIYMPLTVVTLYFQNLRTIIAARSHKGHLTEIVGF